MESVSKFVDGLSIFLHLPQMLLVGDISLSLRWLLSEEQNMPDSDSCADLSFQFRYTYYSTLGKFLNSKSTPFLYL